jgi:hypothetical protein
MGSYWSVDSAPDVIGDVAAEILLNIFSFAEAKVLVACSQVSVQWYMLIMATEKKQYHFTNHGYVKNSISALSNTIWKNQVLQEWPDFSPFNNIKNWHRLYKRRITILTGQRPIKTKTEFEQYNKTFEDYTFQQRVTLRIGDIGYIDVCPQMEFTCPLKWESLERGRYDYKRYCGTCRKDVFHVTSKEELERRAKDGQCVSFFISVEGKRSVGCALY